MMMEAKRSLFVLTALFIVLGAAVLNGCQLTDHSERGEVTTEGLNFPTSGYEKVDPADLPRISFDAPHMDMGKIVQGAQVETRFTFTNVGGRPLVITDVRSTCGCTVGKDWPKHPIKPGEEAHIDVSFDSEGRTGIQNKTITVVANTSPPSNVLTLSGEVVGPTATK